MHAKYHIRNILIFIFLLLALHISNAQEHAKATCDSLIKLGTAALEKNRHAQSLEWLFKAYTLAKKNSLYSQEFHAVNNIGTNYCHLSDNGEALDYYLEGYNLAVKKLTVREEMMALANIAVIYLKEGKYNKAKVYFTKVYKTPNKFHNTAITATLNLGTLAMTTNNTKLAKTYYNEAIVLAAKETKFVILAKGGLASCYMLEGHAQRARELAQQLLKITENPEFYNTEIGLLAVIAETYLQENNPDMALVYVNKAIEKKPDLKMKISLFGQLSEISLMQKHLDLAMSYKDSLYNITAKLNEIKNKRLFENSKIKSDFQNFKNQYAQNESRLADERKMFYYILLFVVIIIGFILWTARNLSLKLKQKKLIAERNEQILALELEKEKSELLLLEKQFNEDKAVAALEQEKLKNEVELKNRKLSAKALYLTGRNEIIEEILSELSISPEVATNKPLKAQMKSLKNQLTSDKEWDRFITHFEEVNQGFLTALKTRHTNLTVNDIRYISYLYMNLSTKEIASMLNITQESCRKRKERVLSKLGLSKETNIYNYLTSL